MASIKHAKPGEDPFQAFLDGIEEDVGHKIFTMKVLGRNEHGLESVIVFENKSVLYGHVKSEGIGSQMALILQADFI